MQLKRTMAKGAGQSRSIVLRQIIALVTINPECTSQSLSGMLKVPLRTIQRYIAGLARSGTLRWRQDGWHVSKMVA